MRNKVKRSWESALVCLSALAIVAGCAASKGAVRHNDIIDSREGALPVALRFPDGVTQLREGERLKLEARKEKSLNDLWALTRYRHCDATGDGHLDAALAGYGAIIAMDAVSAPLARNNIACVYILQGRYRDAELMLQSSISAREAAINAYYNLYILYKYSTRTEDGVRVLMLMKERFPESIFAQVELGDIFMEKGDFVTAENFYRESLAADADSPVPLYRMARLKEHTGGYAEAEHYYDLCIRKFPYFHYAYLDYSNMLLSLNQKEKARKVLNKGIKKMQIKQTELVFP